MTEIVIDVDGPEDVAKHIAERSRRYPAAMERALWEESSITMNRSMRQCPVDTGRMRATGHTGTWNGSKQRSEEEIVAMEVQAGIIEAKIGYYTNYAIYPHEIMENYHDPPSKAKFLEDPVNARADAMPLGLLARSEAYIEGGP